jgi:hypothetical protein
LLPIILLWPNLIYWWDWESLEFHLSSLLLLFSFLEEYCSILRMCLGQCSCDSLLFVKYVVYCSIWNSGSVLESSVSLPVSSYLYRWVKNPVRGESGLTNSTQTFITKPMLFPVVCYYVVQIRNISVNKVAAVRLLL